MRNKEYSSNHDKFDLAGYSKGNRSKEKADVSRHHSTDQYRWALPIVI